MKTNKENREFLKANLWDEWENLELDQRAGIPYPPPQKPYPPATSLINLESPETLSLGNTSIINVFRNRKSRRKYTGEKITIDELTFLLWSTQGVHRVVGSGGTLMKTVPSAGARHPIETYLLINNVDGLDVGLYRYLGIEHKLLPLLINDGLVQEVHLGTYQQYVLKSAVAFIWTAIPYRTEWRYGPLSHKMIAQDSGHICQNLYLACESLGLGICAIGAYDQSRLDQILGIDGDSELTIYVATVGKIECT
jgi:SagB-type dehydrogenase family enzyme